jgi:glycosyltransferase involved in cell wall biosynthesis
VTTDGSVIRPISGFIDGFIGHTIFGWHNKADGVRSAIRIAGRDLVSFECDIERPDVAIALNITNPRLGFEAELNDEFFDGRSKKVELVEISSIGVRLIAERELIFEASKSRKLMTVPSTKTRAAVVCWDLAHNPAGRAYVLYDILSKSYDHVDLIGPLNPRFGKKLWSPLQEMADLNVIAQPVSTFDDLSNFADEVSKIKYDFIWICKPRFPSIFLGLSIHAVSDCRIALDIDDYEMSFFSNRLTAVVRKDTLAGIKSNKIHMADFEATAYAHSVINNFKLRTVSNIALQRTFGGEIVPHSRSQSVFSRDAFDVTSQRAKLGIPKKAKVVVFIGTVRRHKGILEICKAVTAMRRSNVYLLVAGEYESEALKAEILSYNLGKTIVLDKIGLSELPSLLVCGDVICLPQSVSSETAQYQLPAKIVDGLSMGLNVVVTDLPPFADLRDVPGIFLHNASEKLSKTLSYALGSQLGKETIRYSFLQRFSSEILSIKTQSYFSKFSPQECIDELEDVYRKILSTNPRVKSPIFIGVNSNKFERDLVILWKQQDSGLFGRRVDMIAKYFLQHNKADRIILIDAPISAGQFKKLEVEALDSRFTNSRLIYDSLVAKILHQKDTLNFFPRSFVYSNEKENILGRRTTTLADLSKQLKQTFIELNLNKNAILWSCPTIPHINQVLNAHAFKKHYVDLIDDEREFATSESGRILRENNYIEILGIADAVFTNNSVMAKRFQRFSKTKINVVQNGVEKADIKQNEIMRIQGVDGHTKILGYIGNLRDRIDIDLIVALANAPFDWHVVLVGPTGGNPNIEKLASHDRITVTGAMTYEESRRVAAGFDVGLIPHKVDGLTESMNPLKFYLYRELGLSIVSTPVKNLGSINDDVFLSNSDSPEDFVLSVCKALEYKKKSSFWRVPKFEKPRSDLWGSRILEFGDIF